MKSEVSKRIEWNIKNLLLNKVRGIRESGGGQWDEETDQHYLCPSKYCSSNYLNKVIATKKTN